MAKLSKGKCGKKRCYRTEQDALVAVTTRFRYEFNNSDWSAFRAYRCPHCGWWHLTKGRR